MRSLTLVGCIVVFAFLAIAQSDRGTITGTIADPAGAVVAGAGVEARNAANGAAFEAASTATGDYTLSVTVPGFKRFIRYNITVEVAGTTRIDVGLEVGSTNESVTVTESA